MKSSEHCYKAAEHISTYGHHKGKYYENPHNPKSASCVLGAFMAIDPEISTYFMFSEYMNMTVGITAWNDLPETTGEDVILALKQFAHHLEEKGK